MADSGSEKAEISNAGISVNAEGERIIPATVRADGTLRKERKVRPGYRPPEDVEIYRNRSAQGWKQRVESAGVLGAEPASTSESEVKALSANAKKNAKRKEARKKKAAGDGTERAIDKEWIRQGPPPETPEPAPAKKKTEDMTPEEREKAAKGLRKKLRQAQELKKKKDEGEALLPEQLEKVIKVLELTRQLEALGFKE